MKEIGSDFELDLAAYWRPRRASGAGAPAPPAAFLSTGRDAIAWLIRALDLPTGSAVLLPAYVCHDVVAPFVAAGMRVVFYAVESDLTVNAADLERRVSPLTRLVLSIDYFGFPTAIPAVVATQPSRPAVVRDRSHSWLSVPDGVRGAAPDITFASFRKLLPLPDGAAVWWRAPSSAQRIGRRRSAAYAAAVTCRSLASLTKGFGLRHRAVPRALYRRLFALSEALIDAYPKPAPMSRLSRRLLERLDLDAVASVRRRNFQHLLDGLRTREDPRPLFARLPSGVCPLGFPVLSVDRDRLARHLIEHRIYPPVHWELPQAVDRREFAAAWNVSEHILTIPIDQRYGERDMARVVEVVNAFEARAASWAGR